jgi:hypothetical protein
LAWYNNREKQLRKHFQVDTWLAFTSSVEEQNINQWEETECLEKMNKLQYMGDNRDYIVKMEDLNYHVCLSGVAWRQALPSKLNQEIKDHQEKIPATGRIRHAQKCVVHLECLECR